MKEKEGVNSVPFLSSRKGQVTIFVILAVIIVAVAALIYLLYPSIKSTFNLTTDPQSYLQSCVQDELKGIITNISMQGGDLNPQHTVQYYNPDLQKSYNVEYLCYTNKDFQPCTMQQPLLQSHIESQIATNIQPTIDSCFDSLEQNYKNRGYSVELVKGGVTAHLVPNKVVVTANYRLTLTKGTPQTYDKFNILADSNLYELTGIANSILQWEMQVGVVNIGLFMAYYPHLIIEKKVESDGTKVYALTYIDSGDRFQFATRSFAWPPGYGGNI